MPVQRPHSSLKWVLCSDSLKQKMCQLSMPLIGFDKNTPKFAPNCLGKHAVSSPGDLPLLEP
jgi:hypothetical protein